MGELDKIQALFDSGEETNIKLGLVLCESLPESEPLLERYRRLYAKYPKIFNDQTAELWAQIQDIAKAYYVPLEPHELADYVGLLPSLGWLTILVETETAAIHIPAEIGRCSELAKVQIAGYDDKNDNHMPRIVFFAHEALERLDQLRKLEFEELCLATSPQNMRYFKHLHTLDLGRCTLDEPADWLNELENVEEIDLSFHVSMPALTRKSLDGCRALLELSLSPELLPDFPAVPTLTRLRIPDATRERPCHLRDLARRFPRLERLCIQGIQFLDLREALPELRTVDELVLHGDSNSAPPEHLVLLPADFSALQQLRELQIRHLYLPDIWENLASAPRLTNLFLYQSRMPSLPENFDYARLESLMVSNNRIQTLPDSLWAVLDSPDSSLQFFAKGNPLRPVEKARLKRYNKS